MVKSWADLNMTVIKVAPKGGIKKYKRQHPNDPKQGSEGGTPRPGPASAQGSGLHAGQSAPQGQQHQYPDPKDFTQYPPWMTSGGGVGLSLGK
eukprot:11614813-Heterocapsa_arctica.AAC.1